VDGRALGTLRARRPPGTPPSDEADGRLLATVAAQLGLTAERVRLRREELAAEMLRRTDEVKSALLAAVSHQLRTPLAAIVTAAGTLQEDAPWAAEDRRAVAATIEGEARRLNRIVTNLLDLSRIESGALRPQRGWYDLGALVDEALERLRPVAVGHRLVVALPDDLPPLPLDYVQIEQVLANLVENAAKYAPAGTTIRVEVERAGDALVVAVADQGPGFPPTALPHLFTPFYRAASPGAGPHGTGLGLAVVKGLVEAHGGLVRAENTVGGGARVSFTLPLAVSAPPGQGAEAGRPRERVA
jgi:two-component system sensor histidine kinase KdpD